MPDQAAVVRPQQTISAQALQQLYLEYGERSLLLNELRVQNAKLKSENQRLMAELETRKRDSANNDT